MTIKITTFLSPKDRLVGISGFRTSNPGWTITEHDKEKFGEVFPAVVAGVYDARSTVLHLHYIDPTVIKATAAYL